jgi:hypothetical protein
MLGQFKSLSANDFDVLTVTEEWIQGAEFNNSWYDLEQRANEQPPRYGESWPHFVDPNDVRNELAQYVRMEVPDCIREYSSPFPSNRRHLILVTTNTSARATDLVYPFYYYADIYLPNGTLTTEQVNMTERALDPLVDQFVEYFRSDDPNYWLCGSVPDYSDFIDFDQGTDLCGEIGAPQWLNRVEDWRPRGVSIDHCLYEPVEEQCTLSGNVAIISVVIVCNFVKLVCMCIVATRLRDNPLITIGDAIESFLNEADNTTKGQCLLNQANGRSQIWDADDVQPRAAVRRKHRWHLAASRVRWGVALGLLAVCILVSWGLFGFATEEYTRLSGKSIGSQGLGKVDQASIVSTWFVDNIRSPSTQIIASVLVANTPQAILSFVYLQVNALLTSMWLASEYDDFSRERKALRTSNAKGEQRSTHFLQLPYKVAIPLMVGSGLLHWLISQSIYIAVVARFDINGELVEANAIASCGFSPVGILLTVFTAMAVMVAVSSVGWFPRFSGAGMPLVGSCSAAISATCHRPHWDVDASLKPVMWGVVDQGKIDREFGHCSFSSGHVDPVEDGKLYAGFGSESSK